MGQPSPHLCHYCYATLGAYVAGYLRGEPDAWALPATEQLQELRDELTRLERKCTTSGH